MSRQKEFERGLQRIFKKQTYHLRKAAGIKLLGKVPTLTREKHREDIEQLQQLALSMSMRGIIRREFTAIVHQRKTWRVTKKKGWGREAKRKNFDAWFSRYVHYPNCIYVFWAGKRCRYVGRTVRGKGRPQSHFEKHWFSGVTRIDIYSVRQASQIPKLECLAIHRWKPRNNKHKSASQKWTKRCPICEMLRQIRTEADRAFPLRRKRRRRKKHQE